jgi:DNA-binding transcriptional MocR family regulator
MRLIEVGIVLERGRGCRGVRLALARAPLDLASVTNRLASQRIMMHSLARYFCGAGSIEGLVLGFGAASVQEIRNGLRAAQGAVRLTT